MPTMRGVGIAVMAAVGGMLLSPATPLADGPPAAPKAALTVRVRVLDDAGLTSDAKLDLNVTKAPKPSGVVREIVGTSTGQGQGAASVSPSGCRPW